MKRTLITFAVILLAVRLARTQGTIYLSNLDQPSNGNLAIGGDSWLAVGFQTGSNADGYTLNSVQLAMTDASGNPSGFTVMICANKGIASLSPGSSLGTLYGSLNPVSSGIYTYSPASDFTLSSDTPYFIVLTGGTAIANGAYNWSYVTANSYDPSGGWRFPLNGSLTSSDGSSWSGLVSDFPQFAITAEAIPEPGVLGLFALGGLCFLWHRRNARPV